jgi:threonyl-tRNA synthetase
VVGRCRAAGIRAEVDARNETLNYKIRDAETLKVPYMAVVGQREVQQGTLAVRTRGVGKKQEILSVEAFLERLRDEIGRRSLTLGAS